METMKNKVCVVTGATSGIGKVAAQVLAARGATVVLVSRTQEKGELTLEEVRREGGGDSVELVVSDLSSLAETRKLASEIRSRYDRIDVLMNNAGGINQAFVPTVEGFETTWAVNHLSHFLLTHLLLDMLKASDAARVINVSSQAHHVGRIHFDDPGLRSKYNPMKAYAQSKLANVLFTYELERRLDSAPITVNALHPGTVDTGFGKNLNGVAGFFFKSCGFMMRSPEHGARTMIWLATDPGLEGVTGKYFLDCKPIRSSALSHDEVIARRFWDLSARQTGVGE